MRLLYLVEEHHAVRFPSHCLGELSSLIIADISRRSTDKPADAELLLILAHVYSRHHGLIVEQILCQCLCQFSLADTRSTKEYERCYRPLGVLQSRT